MHKKVPWLLVILATVWFSRINFNLHAAAIQNVAITAVSSELVSGADQRRATNLLGRVGLFGDFHATSPQGCMWRTVPTTTGAYTNAFVTFDLGSVHPLSAMKVWNYNEANTAGTQRGIQSANISTAGDDQVFTMNLTNVLFTRAPGVFSNFSQTINFSNAPVRYVRINVLTNWYTGGTPENLVGLSKVQFIDTNVPPTVVFASRGFLNNRVAVHFSETVSAATATNIANYSVFSGVNTASVVRVTMDSFSNIVYLQTSTLDSNLVYTLATQNVRDAANVTSITNTSLTIESELALWLKGDAGVTADANNFVTAWNDQSGNNNHASQSDTNFQPTLVTNALNGKPVVRFNGLATNYMEAADASSLLVRRDLTIYAVMRFDDFTNYNCIISKTLTNQPAPFDFYTLNANLSLPRLLRGDGGANSSATGVTNVAAGTAASNYCVISVIVNGTNAVMYLNGATNGIGVLAAGIADAGRALRIGSRADSVTRLKGDIAEIILTRGAFSLADRFAMDTYLGGKYGISMTKPLENISLTAQISGGNISLSWPTPVTTFVLESATNAAGSAWNAVPNSINSSYGTNSVNISTTPAQQFFRLHQ